MTVPISNQVASGLRIGILLQSVTNQSTVNDDSSFAADGHAIQTQLNSRLSDQCMGIQDAAFRAVLESSQGEHGALVNDSTVDIVDLDIRDYFSTHGSDGAIPDFEILNLNEFSLQPFGLNAPLIGQGVALIPISDVKVAPSLSQGENQENKNALQHGSTLSLQW
jgi:hypothetical protein